jgi:hypothetical protein
LDHGGFGNFQGEPSAANEPDPPLNRTSETGSIADRSISQQMHGLNPAQVSAACKSRLRDNYLAKPCYRGRRYVPYA